MTSCSVGQSIKYNNTSIVLQECYQYGSVKDFSWWFRACRDAIYRVFTRFLVYRIFLSEPYWECYRCQLLTQTTVTLSKSCTLDESASFSTGALRTLILIIETFLPSSKVVPDFRIRKGSNSPFGKFTKYVGFASIHFNCCSTASKSSNFKAI
jgi:hypothetical protein